jgi:signal transduction histidine kinase
VRLPLIVLNKKLQVLTANRSFYDTFKLTPEKTENQLIYKLNGNAWNIPKLKVLLEKILPANTHLDNYEVEIDLPHVGKRNILLNARRTYRQVNNTEAILLAFEDITARKKLEKQKDDFIGIVSHELKTPLTSIKAYSQILERHLSDDNDQQGLVFLSKMTSQMERLTQLMASFVNVYKIQNGKLVLHKKNFDLGNLITTVVSDFHYTTKSHVIEYTNTSKIIINADQERIAQVLINLISNAVKYSPNKHKVRVTVSQTVNTTLTSVEDYGLGIPLEVKEKIFDRFFRVKGKKENNISGLGLGLYISYEIITLHKGKIWVDSVEGKGSTFYFSLPTSKKYLSS